MFTNNNKDQLEWTILHIMHGSLGYMVYNNHPSPRALHSESGGINHKSQPTMHYLPYKSGLLQNITLAPY